MTAPAKDDMPALPQPASPAPRDPLAASLRWILLLALLMAAAVLTAATINVGAYAHDAAAEHVPRGLVFSGAVSDGYLWPRWAQFLHVGLGSPLFTFQPPLPYYGMDLLARLGLGHPLGWRILIGAGLALAFTGAFLLVYTITGRRWPAAAAATAYLYAPYVLRNSLERGSNEAFGMFLYPWVLWSLLWLAQNPSAGRLILATLIWAACIGMHVLAPLLLAPVALLTAIIAGWHWRTPAPLLALLAGGLLMAVIWLPMGAEQANVHIERNFSDASAIPADNPIPLDRLLALPAVYDVARGNNSVGDRIGLAHTVLLLLGVPGTLGALWRRRYGLALALGLATLIGLGLLWMFTAASNPLWELLEPLLYRVQYRTRLMGVQALAAAVTAGALVALLHERWQKAASLALAGLSLLIAIPSLYVDLQHRFGDFGDRITWEDVRAIEWRAPGTALTAFGEFEPRWRQAPFDEALQAELGEDFDPQDQPLANPPAAVQVLDSRVDSSAWNLQLEASEPATATLHLLYYPRWQAQLDGQPVALRPEASATGYAQVDLPAGQHALELRYASSAAERAGLSISVVAALALLGIGVGGLRRRLRRAADASAPAGLGMTERAAPEAAPPAWLLVGLAAFIGLKLLVIDPSTTLFRCQSTAGRVCGADAAVAVAFDAGPSLRGYAVPSREVRPGGTVRVDLVWEAKTNVSETLQSFVHVRNSQPGWPVNPATGSEIWAQDEHVAPGGLLMRDLIPGRLYLDEFRIALPEDIPPGEYLLEVGWFDAATGEQLDPLDETMSPPMRELWRSVLLPSITVE